MAGTGNLVATIMSTFQLYFSLDLNEIPVVLFIGTSIFFLWKVSSLPILIFNVQILLGFVIMGTMNTKEYIGVYLVVVEKVDIIL